MKIVVPIDGSTVSFNALRFAADLARSYDGTLHTVHITDVHTDETDRTLDQAREVLADEGIDNDPTVVSDVRISNLRGSNQVGDDILELIDEHGYNHVVMGHHVEGWIGNAILGSAAETVVQSAQVPVTIVP